MRERYRQPKEPPLPKPRQSLDAAAKEILGDQPQPPVLILPPAVAPAEDESEITQVQAEETRAVIAEIGRRRIEGLRLYEPLPIPGMFHASKAPERLLRGSNRAGKTLAAAVEIARAVTGQDPYKKFPKEDGRCFCVGKDGKHLAQVMYRKLFTKGAFRMIRDLHTREWRSMRPWVPEDLERSVESRPSAPLIPSRMVKSVAWENKKEHQPNIITLTNGWELSFFSSLGKPPQGSDLDLVWFDEEIIDPDWYPEMAARLIDRRGRFLWSATPQAGTDQLYDLHERCEKEALEKKPRAAEFIILLQDNAHMSDEQKRDFIAKLSNPDEVAVRVGGEFAIVAYKMYPEFSMKIHGVKWQEIPADWSRYMIVDPGHQICAVLFAAVPPREVGDYVYLYDELYIRECDAEKFGLAVANRASGQQFVAFIIDGHAGRQTQIAAGQTVEKQYSDALRKHRVASVKTGSGFVWGGDDVDAGCNAVRAWLRHRDGDQGPKLRVLENSCPNFESEIKRYHKKREGGIVRDVPDNRKKSHLMDDLRYLALYNPRYHKPSAGKKPLMGSIGVFREKQKKRREKEGAEYVRLG